uniref:Bm43 n=1 Tax=Brugia malayi TaxID=6279 RepID=A0A1I9GC48_BRUMA|nr:Bm43 [Brugia malayi]
MLLLSNELNKQELISYERKYRSAVEMSVLVNDDDLIQSNSCSIVWHL